MEYKGALFAISIMLLAIAAVGAESGKAPPVQYRVGSGAVQLQGPWERFEGLVSEDGMASSASRIVAFPLRASAPRSVSPGPATYRIGIRVELGGSPSRKMALYVPAFAGLVSVRANRQTLYDRSRDPAAPPLLLFEPSAGESSLILQAGPGRRGLEDGSSFPSFVLFGDAESVDRARLSLGFASALQCGFFLLVGLFVFILYLFWKKNRDFLAFSAYMATVGLYRCFECSAFFVSQPLGLGGTGLEVAHAILVDLQYAALAFFIIALYRDRIRPAAAIAAYAIPAALAAAALALPAHLGAIRVAGAVAYSLLGSASLAFFVLLAARGDKRARWLIPAFLAVPASLLLRRFGPATVWNAYLAEPAGLAASAVVIMMMLIGKVADTFESAEALTDYVASVSRTVKSFIPKEFLDHLEKSDFIDLRLGDHAKKEMTIFFSDIRAFTELSEKLTVEENFAFINSYLARVVPIIKENGGFVDKYVGDGIMALFPGAQGPDEAIRAAIAMQTKVVEYNGHRAKMGYRSISMGVGVHTGDLMLGVVGVIDRMENTVISDAVNISSRLQAIAKAFNIGLVISDQSFKELEDPGSYKSRFIGKVKVKGKSAPIAVFEIFDGIAPELYERKMKANMFFEQGMLSYYQKDFAGAMYNFKRTLETVPEDGAAAFYLDNCMNKATL
jgi:class 3 adenylate cyclase